MLNCVFLGFISAEANRVIILLLQVKHMFNFLEVNEKWVRDHFLIELKIFLIQFLKIHLEVATFSGDVIDILLVPS